MNYTGKIYPLEIMGKRKFKSQIINHEKKVKIVSKHFDLRRECKEAMDQRLNKLNHIT